MHIPARNEAGIERCVIYGAIGLLPLLYSFTITLSRNNETEIKS